MSVKRTDLSRKLQPPLAVLNTDWRNPIYSRKLDLTHFVSPDGDGPYEETPSLSRGQVGALQGLGTPGSTPLSGERIIWLRSFLSPQSFSDFN
jgi:hypothetical protein